MTELFYYHILSAKIIGRGRKIFYKAGALPSNQSEPPDVTMLDWHVLQRAVNPWRRSRKTSWSHDQHTSIEDAEREAREEFEKRQGDTRGLGLVERPLYVHIDLSNKKVYRWDGT